jgi:hypothetical protein
MGKKKKIRVVVVAPDQATPFVKEIDNELRELQEIVGGHIELVRYGGFDIFCNEEGKLDGLPLNRPLYDGDKMVEVLAGQFFISMADDEGNQRNMKDDEIKKAIDLFTFTPDSYQKFLTDLRAIGVKVVEQ